MSLNHDGDSDYDDAGDDDYDDHDHDGTPRF